MVAGYRLAKCHKAVSIQTQIRSHAAQGFYQSQRCTPVEHSKRLNGIFIHWHGGTQMGCTDFCKNYSQCSI